MLTFKRNMGTADRTIRIIVGICLLIAGPVTNVVELPEILEIILGVLGVFAILSAVLAYCMLYEFTGSNTTSNN